MRRIAWIPAAILMVLCISSPSAAVSTITEDSSSNGRSAHAELGECFIDLPAPGQVLCDFRSVWLFTGWSSDGGQPTRVHQVCLSRSTFIQGVTGDVTSAEYASGCSSDAVLAVSKDLGTASVTGTITAQHSHCDPEANECESLGTLDVALDIDWTATGPATPTKVNTREEYPTDSGTCVRTVFSSGQDRSATASGSWGGEAVTFDSAGIGEGVSRFTVRCQS